jgi:hypothetical protein
MQADHLHSSSAVAASALLNGAKRPMTALGQWRRFDPLPAASGLPLTADLVRPGRHVSNVPTGDSSTAVIVIVAGLTRQGRNCRAAPQSALLCANAGPQAIDSVTRVSSRVDLFEAEFNGTGVGLPYIEH